MFAKEQAKPTILWTTRDDGVYIWKQGQLVGLIPASECKALMTSIMNRVDY